MSLTCYQLGMPDMFQTNPWFLVNMSKANCKSIPGIPLPPNACETRLSCFINYVPQVFRLIAYSYLQYDNYLSNFLKKCKFICMHEN